MKRLLIAGAGGHGAVAAEAAELQGDWDVIELLDDRYGNDEIDIDWTVVGRVSDAPMVKGGGHHAIVAIGENHTRLGVAQFLVSSGYHLVDVIHPNATISPRARSGGGNLFLAGSVVNVNAILGHSCIVNTGATVDHDCTLGDGVHVSPGAHLAASVTVGDASWIGTGVAVRDNIQIGRNCIIGAGAAVVKSIADDTSSVGVPAKPI